MRRNPLDFSVAPATEGTTPWAETMARLAGIDRSYERRGMVRKHPLLDVAMLNGRVVGASYLYQPDLKDVATYDIAVETGKQDRGIGEALIAAVRAYTAPFIANKEIKKIRQGAVTDGTAAATWAHSVRWFMESSRWRAPVETLPAWAASIVEYSHREDPVRPVSLINAAAKPAMGKCLSCGTLTQTAQPFILDDVHTRSGATLVTPCRKCGRLAPVRDINGVHAPGVKCNAKCVGAKSYDCMCECGGVNHGAGFRVK